MAKLNLDRATLAEFLRRIGEIQTDTPRRWGKMDATRSFRHLIFTLEMSLGIQQIEDRSKPLLRDLAYLVFFCWMTTWPKGKIKGPSFVTPAPKGDFDSERAELIRLNTQFVAELERNPERTGVNPILGAIPLTKWSRVHGVHTDHHLRQFGV